MITRQLSSLERAMAEIEKLNARENVTWVIDKPVKTLGPNQRTTVYEIAYETDF